MSWFTAFLSGFAFAAGLVISGMTMPAKVLGFLDFTGDWDPTLAFVMGGAVLVYAPLFRLIVRLKWPLAAQAFQLPLARRIDVRLLTGAALFGMGWGIAGVCPGPALVVAGSGAKEALVFVAAMLVGAYGFRVFDQWQTERKAALQPVTDV